MKRFIVAALLLVIATAHAQISPSCEYGFRLVEHALGESCVPLRPQRVVPLDMTITELMLIAGMEPAAVSDTVLRSYAFMHPDLEPLFNEVRAAKIDVGFPPNVEAILRAEPNLIIGPRDLFTETLYPRLAQIAPTVLYDPSPGQWRERLVFAGSVLGLSETVEVLLAEYDERLDVLREVLSQQVAAVEVSLVRVFPGQIGLVLAGTSADATLQAVGLARPPAQSLDYEYVLENLGGRPELLISVEELLLADGDIMFYFGDTSELITLPLWQAVPAVREGRAHEVGYYWWGDSLLSAHRMLDDLFYFIAGVDTRFDNPLVANADHVE